MPGRGDPNVRGSRNDRKKPSKPPQTREVTISRQLSYLLRHKAEEEGIHLDEGGWANVADVLRWRRIASLKVTIAELNDVVNTNDKQRFQMIPNPNPANQQSETHVFSDPSQFLIRAVQGHSITTVSAEKLLKLVSASDTNCPMLVVHGTYPKFWDLIQQSGGLKAMDRNHIHFAIKEPKPMGEYEHGMPKPEDKSMDAGQDGVLSGMRSGATVLIWVDVRKSMQGGVKWYRSNNDVFLTTGLEKEIISKNGESETEKILGFEWVRWVQRRGKAGEVLWKNEDADVEKERMENQMGRISIREGEDDVGKVDKVRGSPKIEPQGPVKEHWDD